MKIKPFVSLLTSSLLAASAWGGAVSISSPSLQYSENFTGLGNGTITWNDGETIPGWYMKADRANYGWSGAEGVPNELRPSSSLGSSQGAYHMNSTNPDQALVWYNGSTTGQVSFGLQFQNTTEHSLTLSGSAVFQMEQWRADGSDGTIALEYKITNSGGNILSESGWTRLASSELPNPTVKGATDGTLAANQFTLSGQLDQIQLESNQYLTFRIRTALPNGTAIGVSSAEVNLIPEPSQVAGVAAGASVLLAGLAKYRRRQKS